MKEGENSLEISLFIQTTQTFPRNKIIEPRKF